MWCETGVLRCFSVVFLPASSWCYKVTQIKHITRYIFLVAKQAHRLCFIMIINGPEHWNMKRISIEKIKLSLKMRALNILPRSCYGFLEPLGIK